MRRTLLALAVVLALAPGARAAALVLESRAVAPPHDDAWKKVVQQRFDSAAESELCALAASAECAKLAAAACGGPRALGRSTLAAYAKGASDLARGVCTK